MKRVDSDNLRSPGPGNQSPSSHHDTPDSVPCYIYGICGGQFDTETRFSPSTLSYPLHYPLASALYSFTYQRRHIMLAIDSVCQ